MDLVEKSNNYIPKLLRLLLRIIALLILGGVVLALITVGLSNSYL